MAQERNIQKGAGFCTIARYYISAGTVSVDCSARKDRSKYTVAVVRGPFCAVYIRVPYNKKQWY